MNWKTPLLLLCPLLVPVTEVRGVEASPVLEAMRAELERSMEVLGKQDEPPYFLSYEVTDHQTITVAGAFGTLETSRASHSRLLDIDLRVGGLNLDNTHELRGGMRRFGRRFSRAQVPLEDDPEAIRAALWYHTDAAYKSAVERLTQVRTNVQVQVEEEDRSADFSREPTQKYLEDSVILKLDRKAWERRIRRLTAMFADFEQIYAAQATLSAQVETRWYVNSEGSEIQISQPSYRLFLSAVSKAEDGMELPLYKSYFSFTAEGLPADEEVLDAARGMIEDLLALRQAPVIEPYVGPAILSGEAAGVFFHEIFGHRVEGHRQKRSSEGQTFKKQVGQRVLPETFSIHFDPTLRSHAGFELNGHYLFDNEGVKSRRVTVVENGVLQTFLMSRSPIEGFPSSNGHGRKQPGRQAVARQSNLLVEVSETVSPAELRQRLIEEIKSQDKPYGLVFENIQGGFTMTGRFIPNAFNVLPLKVYRVFPDGREELVRGVDLVGTPLTAFRSIVTADDQIGIFNGICGAESGAVPVSAASPSILISLVEVQKKQKSQDRPPILPAPSRRRDS